MVSEKNVQKPPAIINMPNLTEVHFCHITFKQMIVVYLFEDKARKFVLSVNEFIDTERRPLLLSTRSNSFYFYLN